MTSTSADVPKLPLQLWVQIIEKARPCLSDFEAYNIASRGLVPKGLTALFVDLACFGALRQVCKGFNQVFHDDPLNFALCVLCNSHQQPAPEELLWLLRHQDQVQHLVLFKYGRRLCSLDTALHPLGSSGSQLKSVRLADPEQLEVNCCAAFTALTSCTLAHARISLQQYPVNDPVEISLKPLHALPNLTALVLQAGVFFDLHNIQNLTRLQLLGAQAESTTDCLLVKTLSHLHVSDGSWLSRLHEQGLFACERLVHLCIKGSYITADTHHTCWRPATEHQISAAVTTLTLLTCLKLHLGTRTGGGYHLSGLEYVTHLTNLKQLEIGSSRHSFTVPTGISRLTMLSSLRIFSSKCTVVKLYVNWCPLQLLQKVRFGSGPYMFDEKLLELTEIKALSEVALQFHPGSGACACCFASLLEHFQQSALHVKLCIG